jgi:hypothetical protein
VPRPPSRPGRLRNGPFRGTDAIAAGLITRAQLRSSAWRRLFRDVYVSSTTPLTHLLSINGAALILPPGAALTGRSAALVWGVKLRDYDGPVEIATPNRFGPVTGLKITVMRLDPDDVTQRWGLPITSVACTAWQLGRSLPIPESVAWIDALGRCRGLERSPLTVDGVRRASHRGGRRAAEALNLCDPRAESPPESHLRVAIVSGGLPAPIPQYNVRWNGDFVARVDLAWPELRFAVEYDGQWHVDPAQLADDRSRLRALTACGWVVYHVTNRDMRDLPTLIADLTMALKRRAAELGVA